MGRKYREKTFNIVMYYIIPMYERVMVLPKKISVMKIIFYSTGVFGKNNNTAKRLHRTSKEANGKTRYTQNFTSPRLWQL